MTTNIDSATQEKILNACGHLEMTAKDMGISLCMDMEAIQHLEDILLGLKEYGVDPKTFEGASFLSGAYLGEIVRRKTNGVWLGAMERNELAIVVGETQIYPFVAIERFASNSEENSLVFWANAILAKVSQPA